jgi:hypothetical protein
MSHIYAGVTNSKKDLKIFHNTGWVGIVTYSNYKSGLPIVIATTNYSCETGDSITSDLERQRYTT